MYVYERNNNIIKKFEVFYDREKLEDLKDRIITNCSYVKHIKTETTNPYAIKGTLDYEIRNLTYKENPPIDRFDHFEDNYDVEYDKVTYPKLVGIIYSFLRNEVTAIKDLNEYEIEYPTEFLSLKIDMLNDEINNIPNTKFDLKRQKLDELQNLVLELDKNKDKTSTEVYFEELKTLINAQYIDEMDINEINHATKFLNAPKIKYLNNLNITKINKVVKRNLK